MLHDYLLNSLSSVPLIKNEQQTRCISPENPKGEKGAGGKAASKLGPGRKGRAYIDLKKGETASLAEIHGPGIIQHIWITVRDKTDKGFFVLRDLVLRMYWDDETSPSVEVPLGDFFCNGFARRCNVTSIPIVVAPNGGMNSYFPMPFRKSARIQITNEHEGEIEALFYTISYALVKEVPDVHGYFHAQWRRENPTKKKKDYLILDGVKGRGQYIGTFIAWAALSRYWWGEGEIKFYLDDDRNYPTICGTGLEDYFGGAWAFQQRQENEQTRETTYCTPFLGYPFYSTTDTTKCDLYGIDAVPMHGLYRWHIMDPIRFSKNLRVTIQQIGHDGERLFEREDDVASVAYWYQKEPHTKFSDMLPVQERWPR